MQDRIRDNPAAPPVSTAETLEKAPLLLLACYAGETLHRSTSAEWLRGGRRDRSATSADWIAREQGARYREASALAVPKPRGNAASPCRDGGGRRYHASGQPVHHLHGLRLGKGPASIANRLAIVIIPQLLGVTSRRVRGHGRADAATSARPCR